VKAVCLGNAFLSTLTNLLGTWPGYACLTVEQLSYSAAVAYPGILFEELRTEDRENGGDLGAVAPYSVVLEAAVICYKEFHFI